MRCSLIGIGPRPGLVSMIVDVLFDFQRDLSLRVIRRLVTNSRKQQRFRVQVPPRTSAFREQTQDIFPLGK